MTLRSQETRLPSAPERGEAEQLAGSSSCVTTATFDGHREDAAGKVSAPENGNRKSSARNSGSASGGITSVEVGKASIFPRDGKYDGTLILREPSIGLTKREYIAALALQGILTHGHNDLTYESVVRDAVVYADELLKELAK